MDVPYGQSVMNIQDRISSDLPVQTQTSDTRDKVTQIAPNLISAPSSAIPPAAALQTKTVSIGKVAFQLNEMFATEKPLVHEMASLSFDSGFFNALVLYLKDSHNPAPIPQSDQDLSCLEYMFFKSFNREQQKTNQLRARQIVELMGQHRPHDPSTRMVMAYLACSDFNTIYSYAEIKDFITKAKILNPKSIELHLLEFWAAKQEGDISTIVATSLILSQQDRSFDSALILSNYLHDPQVLSTMIIMCEATRTEATGYELQMLLLNKEYHEVLNKARVWLKEKPSTLARHCIIRAFLKLNRIEECEAFVRSEKMQKDHLVQALIFSAKKQDAYAYQSFIKYFQEEINKKTLQFWTVLELCEVLERLNPRVDDVIMSTLARAVETDRSNVKVARQAFFGSIRFHQNEMRYVSLPLPGSLLGHLTRIDPSCAHRYDLMYAKYLMNTRDTKGSILIADSLYKKVISDVDVDQKLILDFADLLALQERRELELALLKEHYEATYDEEYLQKYVNCMQVLKIAHLAVDVVAKHVGKFPNSVRANVLLACFLESSGRYDEALDAANKALSLDPHNQYALILRSELFFRKKEYEKCIEDFTQSAASTHAAVTLIAARSLPKVFKSYLNLNRLAQAKKLLKHPNSDFAIGEELRQEYAEKVRAKKEKKSKEKPALAEQVVELKKVDDEKPLPFVQTFVEQPLKISPAKASPEPQHAAETRSEPVRNLVPQAPIHLQSSKKDVTNLDAHAKLKAWSNNPALLSDVCPIDKEIYGISRNPTPAAALPSFKESYVEQRLNPDEYNRLEVAHQAIIQIGDLLRQEKERCSPNPDDPGNFLFPRAFAYHVLKFSEALSPTSSNRKDVSEAFKNTVQTHILSMKLIVALRQAMRHEFQLVDFKKLKALGHELATSTVKENIKAYRDQAAPKEIKGKEPKEVRVSFQERTTISKKQDIANHATPDYFQEAKNELMGMAKVTRKFIENGMLSDILKENFYMDGLKMSVCNIEECVKRLGGSEDSELRDIFYFGNRVAHDMGENPKLYVNEEISPQRMLRIINKAESILARIKLIAKR